MSNIDRLAKRSRTNSEMMLSNSTYYDEKDKVKHIKGFNSLHVAAMGDDIERAKNFIATSKQHLNVVTTAGQHGENDCFLKGYSALLIATKRINFEIVKLLVDSGADLELLDENGNTALNMRIASSFCSEFYENIDDIALYLILNGASLNVIDRKGKGVAQHCWNNGNFLPVLLYFGADMSVKNRDGLTFMEERINTNRAGKLVEQMLEWNVSLGKYENNPEIKMFPGSLYYYANKSAEERIQIQKAAKKSVAKMIYRKISKWYPQFQPILTRFGEQDMVRDEYSEDLKFANESADVIKDESTDDEDYPDDDNSEESTSDYKESNCSDKHELVKVSSDRREKSPMQLIDYVGTIEELMRQLKQKRTQLQ